MPWSVDSRPFSLSRKTGVLRSGLRTVVPGLLFQLGTRGGCSRVLGGAQGCSGVLRGTQRSWMMGEDLDGRPWCSRHGAAPSRVTPGDFG